jgi:endonuclease YncB( thermonuclease family)
MRFTVFILLLASCASSSAATLTGRVVRVTDGDTIVILSVGNVQHKIRLQGIGAPERSQAFGNKSREHLSEMVASQLVVVEYDKRDRYGRIVGKVLVGGEDTCLEQIAAGFAWHYKKYQNEQTETDRQRYSEAEIKARAAKLGLWKDPHAVPPWEYRAVRRNR